MYGGSWNFQTARHNKTKLCVCFVAGTSMHNFEPFCSPVKLKELKPTAEGQERMRRILNLQKGCDQGRLLL